MDALIRSVLVSLDAVGGSLAVAFIITLAVGIVAMTLVYLGSALLVLDRFARVARGWGGAILAGAVVAALVALMATVDDFPADAVYSWAEWREAFGRHLMTALGSCLVFISIAKLMVSKLGQGTISWIAVATLAVGVGAALIPTMDANIALLTWAAAAALAVIFWLYRHWTEQPGSSGAERLRWLVACGFLPRLWLRFMPQGLREGRAGQWYERLHARAKAASTTERVLWLLAIPTFPLVLASFHAASGEAVGDLSGHVALTKLVGASMALVSVFIGLILLGLVPLAMAGFAAMRKSVEWFIAIRYLFAKRRQVFISAITAICVGGIAAGVWLIIVVLSVMNGFEQTWREEILGNRAHFTVHSQFGPFGDFEEVLRVVLEVPGVEAASPYIDAEGMVRGSQGQIASVRLRGVDPTTVGRVTDLENDLRPIGDEERADLPARFASLGDDPKAPGIIIGGHLALSMGLAVGDTMLLISPFGGPPTPLGPGPRLKRFTVVGIFESSFYQYDEAFTYTTLEAARDFRKAGDVVDGIEARTTDHYRSQIVGREVQERLQYPYYTRDWKEVFPAFFQALKTERVMMFLLLTMIMVVAAFVIVATLVMMIMEKSSDIAILKAMGAQDAMIERIFALEGTLIGLVGTALGVAAGIAVTGQLSWIQDVIERLTGIDTLPASVYQFSELPSRVDPVQVAGVAAIAMILSLGATLLPSRQGARIDPAAGLRHE